jgi:hypothetical protein
MFAKIYNFLTSLNLGIWLMVGVTLLLAIGSFAGGEAAATLNSMPLFFWLRETPLAGSWWLWVTIGLLAVMAVNTFLCSIESLRRKYRQTGLLVLLAPQLMHAGFLFIVLAHLFSAYGGFTQVMQLREGSSVGFPDGSSVWVGNITATAGPMGMMTDYSAAVRFGPAVGQVETIRPNEPFFHGGYGLYLKDVGMLEVPVALIEVHREPGAGLALAGALLFTVGNIALLAVRRGR